MDAARPKVFVVPPKRNLAALLRAIKLEKGERCSDADQKSCKIKPEL